MTAITRAPAPPAADPTTPRAPRAWPRIRLTVEYWTVAMRDQDSCGACDATLTTLQDAVAQIRPLAERLGITVDVAPRTVVTWAQALDHAIAASPTIRAAGHELRPTHRDHGEERVWQWRGTASAAIPVEALTDLLVRAVAARSRQLGDYLTLGGPAPYLRQYMHAEHGADAPVTDGSDRCSDPSAGGPR